MATRTLIAKLIFFSPISSLRILRLRPLTASPFLRLPIASSSSSSGGASFSTGPATSSLDDPSPNRSNRPPHETIILDGCDFEHWLVVLEPPDASLTRDEIIDSYIKTLTEVLGSEEEAKKSIYSVSTKHYFAFGCIVSVELSYKIKTLPKVRWVLPDSYSNVSNKDYGGEPFIDGKAVAYDPKYHEWARKNAQTNERSRRNDRPQNYDCSRNFERRRENMPNFQNREAPPMPNQGFQASTPPPPQNATSPPQPPQNATSPPPPQNATSPPPPPNVAYQNQMPNSNLQGSTPGYQGVNQGYQGGGAPAYDDNNFQRGGASGYQGAGGGPPPPPTTIYQGGAGPNFQRGGPGYQGSPSYQADGPDYQGRDLPVRDQ